MLRVISAFTVSLSEKGRVADFAKGFVEMGFTLYATSGTANALKAANVPVKKLHKLNEGRPNALDMIKNGELAMIVNTPSGKVAREDEIKIRRTSTEPAPRWKGSGLYANTASA